MGFGTLFVGYFFILNFPYCAYTDALAALLMLYGLYKLSGINENFKRATYFTAVFALFGIAELFLELFGENGKHARAAVALGGVPLHATAEVQVVLEIA